MKAESYRYEELLRPADELFQRGNFAEALETYLNEVAEPLFCHHQLPISFFILNFPHCHPRRPHRRSVWNYDQRFGNCTKSSPGELQKMA